MEKISGFIKHISDLIEGKPDLTAILVTYNKVAGYEKGVVDAKKPGLSIGILSPEDNRVSITELKKEAQGEMERRLQSLNLSDCKNLIIPSPGEN